MLVDTHCHIHEPDYPLPIADVQARALKAGVENYICVGTSLESSRLAHAFAHTHDTWASYGVHPHDTKDGYEKVADLTYDDRVVAIGEIGLDYFYNHSPREVQIEALTFQLDLAVKHNLPVIFHVREAFDDFWPIADKYPELRAVLHSFTDSKANMEKAVARGWYIGVNGISTFTKDVAQQAMFDAIPLDHLLFETDAPFLTPTPLRGKINEPAFVREVAQYHADRRGLSLDDIAAATTANARSLFSF